MSFSGLETVLSKPRQGIASRAQQRTFWTILLEFKPRIAS